MPSKAQVRAEADKAKWEARDAYSENWHTDLTHSCCAAPGCFCYAIFCPSCISYTNRTKVLRGDMSKYLCCGGHWPCSGKMKEQSCPEVCLCLEVTCCFAQSVASTRWMLQDELRIRNTQCDNCIIGTMVCLQQLSCICSLVACLTDNEFLDDAADLVRLIADIAWCSVCGCMQTQAKVEMEKNDRFKSGAHGIPAQHHAPPQQQMISGGVQYDRPPQQSHQPSHQAPPQQYMANIGHGPPPGYPGTPGYPTAQGNPPANYYQGKHQAGPPPGYPP